jgi:hypothetical protein
VKNVPARRSLATAGTLALVSLFAVGCGDDSGDAEATETETVVVDADGNVIDGPTDGQDEQGDTPVDDSGPALTQEQLESAVLAPENVGENWTGGQVESDVESGSPGCFGDIEVISDSLDPIEVAEHDVEYNYTGGDPSIASGASSYEDGTAVAEAFDGLHEVLGSCTEVVGTDSEGFEWDLDVTYDGTLATDTIDDQVNVTASGTVVDPDGSEFDITLRQSYIRVGKNVLTVGVNSLGGDYSELQTGYTEIAIYRFTSVIIDSEPTTQLGPQPA